MFELTIRTDNPALLAAIAKVVQNTPPVGYNEGKPTPVNVHASIKDMKAAKEAVDLAPDTKVKEVPLDEPTAPVTAQTPEPAAEATARDERRAKLRKLVTDAGAKIDGGIPAAMQKAMALAGVAEAKDLPDCGNFDEVCAALLAM